MALHVSIEGRECVGAPALVLMHFLGGSGREWDEVVADIGPGQRILRVDMPGFGLSAGETEYGVEAMANAVLGAVDGAGIAYFVLVGHSMSGKIAMVIARRLAGRLPGDARLAGLVLVAPSPPGPEPMGEEKRGMMLALLGGAPAEDDFAKATRYINKNETRDLPPAVEERGAREVLLMNRTAWVAWLMHGSKEDWAERVGVLHLPAVLVAGEKDASLGPDVQRQVTMPHLGNARVVSVEGCSHLIPMERPLEMAGILRDFIEQVRLPEVPADYQAFIDGERVAPNTRELLAARVAGPAVPEALFTAQQERTLRAVMARVVPGTKIDLAGFVMARLATGKGDGWRYAVLPEDAQAYRDGLDKLAEDDFEMMSVEEQDKLLTRLAAKKDSAAARWFEEVRGDATSAYVGHPQTMARLGYSGIGVGGAYTKFKGFVQVGVNQREAWEPVAESKPDLAAAR